MFHVLHTILNSHTHTHIHLSIAGIDMPYGFPEIFQIITSKWSGLREMYIPV